MAKALTTESRAKKVLAQEKVVARLAARRDKAQKTLTQVEKPLEFEKARLVHLQNTPVADDILDEGVPAKGTEPEPEATEGVEAEEVGEPDDEVSDPTLTFA